MNKMSEKPVYYDKRSEFWKKYWEQASTYEDYVSNSSEEHKKRWRDSEPRVPTLSEQQIERLTGYDRILKILVYCGVWCGDCVRQGPLLSKIAEACGEKVELKFIERDVSEELQDELRIVGALRVPIIVFLTEDYWEIERYGERTLSVYRSKQARETGRGIDHGILSPTARNEELAEWVNIFERNLIIARLSPPLRRRHND